MIDTTTNPFVESPIEDTCFYYQADGKKMPDEVKGDIQHLFALGEK
jgi:hypothetical protein